jgi:hypothetical protein
MGSAGEHVARVVPVEDTEDTEDVLRRAGAFMLTLTTHCHSNQCNTHRPETMKFHSLSNYSKPW